MRIPSKAVVGKIASRHRKKKIRVSKKASAEMYLFYLCFVKKLAKACDDLCLRRNKLVFGEDIIKECAPRLLTSMSMMETMETTQHPTLAREMSGRLSAPNSDDFESDDELISDEG